MEISSLAPETILSLQTKDGKGPGSWRRDRAFSASKTCPGCGREFTPWIKINEDGSLKSLESEKFWSKKKYCSVQCAKKYNPTVLDAQARKRIKETHKRKKLQPIKRGGNGRLLPLPQLALLHALGLGWEAEYPIKTYAGHRNGVYPNCYKVDIGNPQKMIAIELDGFTHATIQRRKEDKKKSEKLAQLGWRVFRVSNKRALELYSTFESVDTLLTSLME